MTVSPLNDPVVDITDTREESSSSLVLSIPGFLQGISDIYCEDLEDRLKNFANVASVDYWHYPRLGLVDGFSLNTILNGINTILDRLKNETQSTDIYLIGHSLGGYFANFLQAQRDDIKGQVLMSPIISLREYLDQNSRVNSQTRNRSLNHFPKHLIPGSVYDETVELEEGHPIGSIIRVPTKIIYGDDDRIISTEEIKSLSRQNGGSRLVTSVVLWGQGHQINCENMKTAANSHIEEFINELEFGNGYGCRQYHKG